MGSTGLRENSHRPAGEGSTGVWHSTAQHSMFLRQLYWHGYAAQRRPHACREGSRWACCDAVATRNDVTPCYCAVHIVDIREHMLDVLPSCWLPATTHWHQRSGAQMCCTAREHLPDPLTSKIVGLVGPAAQPVPVFRFGGPPLTMAQSYAVPSAEGPTGT